MIVTVSNLPSLWRIVSCSWSLSPMFNFVQAYENITSMTVMNGAGSDNVFLKGALLSVLRCRRLKTFLIILLSASTSSLVLPTMVTYLR